MRSVKFWRNSNTPYFECMTDIIQKIKETDVGEGLQLKSDLLMFRLPSNKKRFAQSYAILRNGKMLLIDAVHRVTKKAVEKWLETHQASGLILTQRDLIIQSFASLEEVSDWLDDIPIFIHPQDAGSNRARNPMEANGILGDFDISIIHAPGYSPGSIMIYDHLKGGTLFTGNAAIGKPLEDEQASFTRPLIQLNKDEKVKDEMLRNVWKKFDKPLRNICPLHGMPALDIEDPTSFLQALRREDPYTRR